MPTIINGDNGVDKVQATAVNSALPSQTGNSGKYLTTDGTSSSWGTVSGGVTSLNGQTGAITNTDYGAIGSYVIAAENDYTANTDKPPNVTVAGSTLVRTSVTGSNTAINSIGAFHMSVLNTAAVSLGFSGTWRRVTRGNNPATAGYATMNLFVRIS